MQRQSRDTSKQGCTQELPETSQMYGKDTASNIESLSTEQQSKPKTRQSLPIIRKVPCDPLDGRTKQGEL